MKSKRSTKRPVQTLKAFLAVTEPEFGGGHFGCGFQTNRYFDEQQASCYVHIPKAERSILISALAAFVAA